MKAQLEQENYTALRPPLSFFAQWSWARRFMETVNPWRSTANMTFRQWYSEELDHWTVIASLSYLQLAVAC